MRTHIAKELRKLFAAELERRLPNFKHVKRPKPGMDPKWVWKIAPKLNFFIKLQPLPRDDHFVLEIGWTDGGEISPRNNYKSSIDTDAREWGARLSQIWDRPNNSTSEQVWDIGPKPSDEQKEERRRAFDRREVDSISIPDLPVEQVLPRVGTLVRDAVDAIEQYALPVFRRVAAARGLN